MSTLDAYLSAVKNSQLLNDFEKQAMTEKAEILPPDYTAHMTAILTGFNERSAARRAEYLSKVEAAFAQFRETITHLPDVSEYAKVMYLKNAAIMEEAIHNSLKQTPPTQAQNTA